MPDLLNQLLVLEKTYLGRNFAVQEARDVYTMKGRFDVPDPGFSNIYTNVAYNVIKIAAAMMSRNIPHLTRPVNGEDKNEKAAAARAEHFSYALLHEADRLSVDSGRDLFHFQLPQAMLVDGWAYVNTEMYPDDAEYPNQTVLLDPMHVYPSYANRRLDYVYHRYVLSTASIREQYGKVISDTDTDLHECVTCWYYEGAGAGRKPWRVDIAFVAEGKSYRNVNRSRDPNKGKIFTFAESYLPMEVLWQGPIRARRIPVTGGPIGGIHWRGENRAYSWASQDWYNDVGESEEWGHSFLYAVTHILTSYHDILSDLSELMDKYIHPVVVIKTRDGTIKEVPIGEKDAQMALLKDESVEVLYVSGALPPLEFFVSALDKMIYQGTIPQELLASPGPGATGFLYNSMNEQAINHLVTQIGHQEWLYSDIIRHQFQQYEMAPAKAVKKIKTLWGTDSFARERYVDFDPKDVGGRYDMGVSVLLATPQQKVAEANMWAILLDRGVVDPETVQEAIHLHNPELIRSRLYAHRISQHPAVVPALAIREMIAQKRGIEAEIIARSLGVDMTTSEGKRINPRTGLVERPLLRPEVLPPSMTQGPPNPEVAGAAGVGPAGAATGGFDLSGILGFGAES